MWQYTTFRPVTRAPCAQPLELHNVTPASIRKRENAAPAGAALPDDGWRSPGSDSAKRSGLRRPETQETCLGIVERGVQGSAWERSPHCEDDALRAAALGEVVMDERDRLMTRHVFVHSPVIASRGTWNHEDDPWKRERFS